ncbi:MAG: ParB/RepB/Spo0J family partition protein [Clostridia bacterium]|nr:ParB/RepB/Spo0J family partition protein [Clostridia bacterium]
MAKRIGKGLSALLANIEDERVLPVQPTEVVEGEKVYNIELDLIEANPNQPRKYFGEKQQRELEDSIRVQGVISPIILVKRDDKYMIVAGERRYRAAKAVGLNAIPAMVKQIDERMIREISLIENLQRENLNAIEEAEAVAELMKLNGYTQEQLANRIGKARSSVANIVRLLSLEDEVKSLVAQDRLSAGHARALIPITDRETQIDFAYQAADGEMSVRELEVKVRYYLNPDKAPRKMSAKEKARLSIEMREFVDDLKRVFGTKVKLVGNDTKGRICIDYYNKDDLQRIYELISTLKQ